MFKKPGVYVNIVLSVVAVAFVINAFNLPGHTLVKKAMATIAAITGEGTITTLPRFTGASGTSNTIGSSIIYDDGSNHIGVNTVAPGNLFTVNQGSNTVPATRGGYGFSLNLSAAEQLTMGADATYAYLQSWSAKPLYINSQGNNVLFGSGNVGIGTTAPATALEVVGLGAYPRGITSTFIGASAGYVNIRRINGTAASPTVLLSGQNAGKVGFDGYDGGVWGAALGYGAAEIGGQAVETWSTTAHGMDIFFNTTPKTTITPLERMRITSEGNVGIGTTGPANKLELGSGSMSFYYGDVSGYGTNAQLGRISAQGDNYHGSSATNSSSEIRFLTGSANYYKGQIAFYTNNVDSTAGAAVERMRIKEDGNVGIGTTGPGAKLDVTSAAAGTTLSLGDNSNSRLNITHPSNHYITFTTTSSGQGYQFNQDSLSVLTLQATTGNVGIGTTGPGAKLEVKTSVNTNTLNDGLILNGDSSGAATPSYYGAIKFSGNAYDWGAIRTIQTNPSSSWTNRMAFFTMNGNAGALTERMAIDNTGNVGIGTTSPGYKLTIAGPVGDWGLSVNYDLSGSGYGILTKGSTYAAYFVGPGYLAASAWAYSSDKRLKENISYLGGGLDKILQLKPAKFDYITGQKNQLGFIAQDVQSVIPEAVMVTDANTGMLGLKTDFIIPYAVNAIKEQQVQIEELKKEIEILKNK